jgi:hypothetical protein
MNRNWKNFQNIVLAFAILIAAFACDEPQKPEADEKLKQAFEVHMESVEIRSQVAEYITKLRQNQDSLFMEKYQTQLDSLYTLVEAWDDQFMEVPGFEHSHDHSHGEGHAHDHHHHHHGHDHVEELDLTSDEHLEIQLHMKDEITSLEKAFSELPK